MITTNRPVRALLLAGALFALAFSAGCSRKDKITNPAASGQIGWNNTIFSLMRDRSTASTTVGCMGCHNGSAIGITDFTEYQNVAADSNNIQFKLSPGQNMRPYLNAGEPEIILDWIARGAPR
jgi:hypothetical protein